MTGDTQAGSRSAFIVLLTAGNRAHWDPHEGGEAPWDENRCQETWEETLGSTNLSTKRQRIAELARTKAGAVLSTLHHVIDLEWIREAYRLTRKDGAPGIDGVTAAAYEANLEANLSALLERIKSGRYVAPPVRRVYIPKADGSERPLGIPTLEDKVAQRAIVMVLEPIYEADFLPCSFGFRPRRSAHQALSALRLAFMRSAGAALGVGRRHLKILRHHPTSSPACVSRQASHGRRHSPDDRQMAEGGRARAWSASAHDRGHPQGGVVSPLLANLFLHHVLDEWYERDVRPCLKGNGILVRYADDSVLAFESLDDAKRVMDVLGKRLARYGLKLHPDKTHLVDCRFHRPEGTCHPDTDGTTFDFLGFTHIWAKSKKGVNGVRASDGQRPVRAGAGGGKRVVPTQSASILARSACPPVPDDARPLCLLRHIRQLSTHTMVRLPGRGAVEEMAGATASRRRRVPVDPPQRDPAAPSASTGADRPPPLRHRERSSPVKNRCWKLARPGL